MSNDATVSPQPKEGIAGRPAPRTWFGRINRWLGAFKGLPLVTVLGSLVVAGFQYSNDYQDKVSAQAKEDMKGATDTFTDVSKRFSEAQTLQQMLFLDFSNGSDEHLNTNQHTQAGKHAQSIVGAYETSATGLLEAGDLIARDAEIYIDWASNFKRDAPQPSHPTGDPLSLSVLKSSDFDCNENLPLFVSTDAEAAQSIRDGTRSACQLDRSERLNRAKNSPVVNVCPRQKDKSATEAITIDWFSAKHQALTLHYCFENLHERLGRIRSWAARPDARPLAKERGAQRARTGPDGHRQSSHQARGLHGSRHVPDGGHPAELPAGQFRLPSSACHTARKPVQRRLHAAQHFVAHRAEKIMTRPPVITATSRIAV